MNQQAAIHEGKFISENQPVGWWGNPIEGFGPYLFNNIIARDYTVCGAWSSTGNKYSIDVLWLDSKTGMSNDIIKINFPCDKKVYEEFLLGKTLTFKGCLKYDFAVGQWYIHWLVA